MPQPDLNHTHDAQQPESLYLALDQGGGSSRAIIYDRSGNRISQASQSVPTDHPAPGQVEQDPLQIIHSLRDCAERVVRQLPAAQRPLLNAWGLACQRSSLIGWDRHSGQPLTAVLSWQDCRAASDSCWTTPQIDWIKAKTGLHPSAHHGATKMRWCWRQLAAVRQAAADNRLLLAPLASYLAMALTGTRARADASTAQRTLLWNINSADWDPQLLRLFDIERRWLPPTAPCLSDWGDLQVAGLSLPGRFVGGDQGCAHFGAGTPSVRALKVNLGTGGFLSMAYDRSTPSPTKPAAGLLLSIACSDPQHQELMLEGTINGAGAAVSWLQQRDPNRQSSEQDPGPLFSQPLHPQPGLFINAVSGLGSPYWRTDLTSRFIECDTPHQRYSALIESILFLVQTNIEQILKAGFSIESIELTGGLSQASGLAQRLSDLTRRPVLLQPDTEATARGLAYLLAGRPEHWQRPSAEALMTPSADLPLQRRYHEWRKQLDQLLAKPRS